MYVLTLKRQKLSTKQSIYAENMNTSIQRLKELANINQKQIVDSTTMLVLVDEHGFIAKVKNLPRWKLKITHAGRGTYTCKGWCRLIPKVDSRKVSYAKTKDFYCATCSIAMKCVRCKCCGRIGRREPRSRNRFTRALLNGNKYIE